MTATELLEWDTLEPAALAAALPAEPVAFAELVCLLRPARAAALVDYLKGEADRHWWIDANRSLGFADQIIQIGTARGELQHTALGTMARGDALKHLGHTEEAWNLLDQAGALFLTAGDEVGWARTRIGKLYISVDLNRVDEALAGAAHAREVFTRHGDAEKQMRLDLNTGRLHAQLGDHDAALACYQAALAAGEQLIASQQASEVVHTNIGHLHSNMGYSYAVRGEFRHALACHERARDIFTAWKEPTALAAAELNISHIAIAQGDYRRALQLLHRVLDNLADRELPLDAAYVERDLIECYLQLNRFEDARDLAIQVCAEFASFGAAYGEALSQLHLATAEVALSNLKAAEAALDAAGAIFDNLNAPDWIATTRVRRGRLALKGGQLDRAEAEAQAAATLSAAIGQQVVYAEARLLAGQVRLAAGDASNARRAGAEALQVARQANVPALRYSAHLLLAQVAAASGQQAEAARRYAAAIATIERVQRGLTITLRPGFLEDKGEALRGLIGLHLAGGRAAAAFETLERAKSQALLGYLANRQALRWASNDRRSQALAEELASLREEHQWFYRLATEPPAEDAGQRSSVSPQQARAEVARCERRMRQITEQLYLYAGTSNTLAGVNPPRLAAIQQTLDDQTLLIEYYYDGSQWYAFSIDRQSIAVHPLTLSATDLDYLVGQLQANIDGALGTGPLVPHTSRLTGLVQRILGRLYTGLLAPLTERMVGRTRLMVVPYGTLHYLPFHLLYNAGAYLIERFEVVLLPAAGLATRNGPGRSGGANVLAHSYNGYLAQACAEAQMVAEGFGGALHLEAQARRAVLDTTPTQILHIAAHGRHRLDQPDLSYIELADGQMYTDDVLQYDLSYELVTLSACETGRARVAAGDEPIGLGRGFLYAGAGALITSLWRVDDSSSLALMRGLYTALQAGASKAAALRQAQTALLAATPGLHPAFWGAFQLIGDPAPLNTM